MDKTSILNNLHHKDTKEGQCKITVPKIKANELFHLPFMTRNEAIIFSQKFQGSWENRRHPTTKNYLQSVSKIT